MSHKTLVGAAVVLLFLAGSACSRPKPIIVGSMTDTGQAVVAEAVAQHLEHRLSRKIQRRINAGGQMIVYQSVTTGEITMYPEYTGSIVTALLKEPPDSQPSVVLERARGEMRRTAQMDLLDPLGYENPPVMVVRASDAAEAKVKTLSDAAAGSFRWKIGLSYDFQQRPDGLIALNTYKLPMSQGVRGMEPGQLFPALQSGDVTMISSNATDGNLISPDFQILADDRHAFPPAQACLLVRADAFAAEPRLRPALAELAGKFSTDAVRKMAAQVDLNHRDPVAVATEFLAQIGLK
jgi:osmoprotectant transport system substrate-binding protein